MRPSTGRLPAGRVAAALLLAAVAAGCSTPARNLPTATGDTRPQPVVVQVPVEVTDPALQNGCWVQFYSDRNFKGEMATLTGPVALDSADKFTGRKLKRHIDSLVTGSRATLRVYEHAMFKDRTIAFGPNSREAGLITKLGIGGEIESLQLDCTAQ